MSITHNIMVLIDYTIIYLALNIITFTIYFTYLKEYTEKVSIINKLNATIALNTYNEESKKTKIDIDILKKDYNNHIQTIYSLYKEDKLEEANNYINALNFKILEISNNFYTKNETIDAILFNKVALCNNHNIKINIKSCIIENISISDYDLCTLLGNLLDNSIEANLYVEKSYREITLKLSIIKNCLVINLSNSTKENHKMRNNKFISIKKEEGHGIGLNQIQSIVHKYNGDIIMEATNEKFNTNIILLDAIEPIIY
ncbi:MAG: sensor histidine kinase [Clostridium sp.]